MAYSLRILFFVAALVLVDWRLSLVVIGIAAALWLVSWRFAGPIKQASREKRRRAGALSAVAEESLSNAMLVQAYNREELEVARFHQQSVAAVQAELDSTRLKALYSPLVDLVQVVGVVVVIALGTWELNQSSLTLGGLLVFLTYLTKLYTPVRGLTDLGNTVFAASAAAERVIELMDEPVAVRTTAAPVHAQSARGQVIFDRVSFAYPGAAHASLSDVSFCVQPGEMLAIVRASGAGKSTISRLLLRFYDPCAGRIFLDGHDLRDLDLQFLREQVAILLQETLIFDGTVAENIAYGRLDASQKEIVAASRAADADVFVRSFPNAYATRIGQKGRKLSGGQRQRIAIARAIVRNAPVLLHLQQFTPPEAVRS
jgi:ATP-binding cassette subfamily B protein